MLKEANGHQAVFPGYKRTRNGNQVLELRFDSVAGCLRTPEGGSSRQLLVICRDGTFTTRLLTVREAARLMGAPENYRILGSYNDGYRAMGDGVAVPAVRYLACHLLAPLSEAWQR
jgi:DNA (cytosine-5)-methyltransferase 1